MGWNGGTEIFDSVIDSINKTKIKLSSSDAQIIIARTYKVCVKFDWDNFCESEYYNNSDIRKAVLTIDPDLFNEY